ncbi:hypothetical protein CH252_35175 [Rhodococcus sp. 06-1477-1B]|nr:hypothetical protein CH252_35175 [Rhodococcus sp. 06-1477-1B]OZD49506.1 hypothetical protein CH266_14425 [Rhodococcus sp. 06-1474-1B]
MRQSFHAVPDPYRLPCHTGHSAGSAPHHPGHSAGSAPHHPGHSAGSAPSGSAPSPARDRTTAGRTPPLSR